MVNKRRIGFVGALLTLILLYAASSAPIPLYSLYQQSISLTKANL